MLRRCLALFSISKKEKKYEKWLRKAAKIAKGLNDDCSCHYFIRVIASWIVIIKSDFYFCHIPPTHLRSLSFPFCISLSLCVFFNFLIYSFEVVDLSLTYKKLYAIIGRKYCSAGSILVLYKILFLIIRIEFCKGGESSEIMANWLVDLYYLLSFFYTFTKLNKTRKTKIHTRNLQVHFSLTLALPPFRSM